QMRAAVRAAHLGADHPVAAVLAQLDVLLIDSIPEARPAAAGLVLRLRAEQRLVADDAAIQPLLVVVVVHTAERRLGARQLRDVKLLGRQPLAQFFFRHLPGVVLTLLCHTSPSSLHFSRFVTRAQGVLHLDYSGRAALLHLCWQTRT